MSHMNKHLVNYHYNEMINSLHSQEVTELQQQLDEHVFSVPFTVEALKEIVY